jgi:hypothetical protein
MATRIVCENQAAARRATARFAGDLTQAREPRNRLPHLKLEESLFPLELPRLLASIEQPHMAEHSSHQVPRTVVHLFPRQERRMREHTSR